MRSSCLLYETETEFRSSFAPENCTVKLPGNAAVYGSGCLVAEIVKEFVGLPSPLVGRAGAGGHPCQGVYHRPAGTRPTTAFIATHYNIDFSEHYLASYLAERGFGFLGWNTRFRGNEANFLLDHALAEIGTGVRWLREQAGADRVVLLGNSGGGSLMAAYQSQAVAPNVTPVAGMRPLDAIADLPRGDLFIALAAHSGRPEVLTAWLDPSVTDESDPLSADPALDPFNPDNGPPYSEDFQRRYRAGQRAPPPHDPPVDRSVGPAAELVLPRRSVEGQLRGVRRRHRQHAPHVAVHVELADLAVHRGAAPGQDHRAVAGGARDGRRLRLRQRRPDPVRCARRRGQDPRVHQGGPLPARAGRRARAGGRSHRRLGSQSRVTGAARAAAFRCLEIDRHELCPAELIAVKIRC